MPTSDAQRLLNVFRKHRKCSMTAADITVGTHYCLGGVLFPLSAARGDPGEAVLVARRRQQLYTAEDVEVRPRLLSQNVSFSEQDMAEILATAYTKTPQPVLLEWLHALKRRTWFAQFAKNCRRHRPADQDLFEYSRALAARFVDQGGLCACSGVPMKLTKQTNDPFRCVLACNGEDLVCAAINLESFLDVAEASLYWDLAVADSTFNLVTGVRLSNRTRNSAILLKGLMKWRRQYRKQRRRHI